jgi:hypothetical protein
LRATAIAIVASDSGNSSPPLPLKKPFDQWTTAIALNMTIVIPSAASGVKNPAANSSPPPRPGRPARSSSGGESRRFSKNPAVPRSPLPPNHPNNFCVPWAEIVRPPTDA